MVPEGKGGETRVETIFTFVYWKKSFKINNWPISIKLGTNISCMMEIQVYSKEGTRLLKREDNHKSAKIG
jgi:hypothetical protein